MADAGVIAKIAVVQEGKAADAGELALARQLDAEICSAEQLPTSSADFYLRRESAGLGLYRNRGEKTGAVRVDFASAAVRHRAADGLRRQSLLKAAGVKADFLPTVLDATAGLGRDAYLLARAGCQVMMLERSSLMYVLLLDGMDRGAALAEEEAAAVKRLSLEHTDFMTADLADRQFDVVYLDPMFPEAKQRALVKKELQLLKELLGFQDGKGMLERARAFAGRRVVVKRGSKSPWLDDIKPELSFSGRSSRYDVYFT